MKKLFLLFALILAPLSLFAQNVRVSIPFPSISSQYPPLLQANIAPNLPVLAVCNYPANATPCTNYATTYDSTGAACSNGAQDTPDPQPSSCQATGDAQGNLGFWIRAGTYDYTVCLQNTVTCLGPYTISVTGGAGSIVFQTNGTNNGNQGKQNLHSSDSSITLTDDGTGNINLAVSSGSRSPNLAFMLGPGLTNLMGLVNGSGVPLHWSGGNNQIVFLEFNLDGTISNFTHLDSSFFCNLGGGENISVGFYDTNGNKLWDSGLLHVPNVVNTAISFTIPSLSLTPSTYYMAWTASSTDNVASSALADISSFGFQSGSSDGNVINQSTNLRFGISGTASSAGALPSTISLTIASGATLPSSGWNVSIPAILFH